MLLIDDERINDRVNAIAACRRNGNPYSSAAFSWYAFVDFFPRRPAVRRFEDAAARPIRRGVDEPWWTTHIPKRGVNDLRAGWIEIEIDRAHFFILEQNFLPGCPAVA